MPALDELIDPVDRADFGRDTSAKTLDTTASSLPPVGTPVLLDGELVVVIGHAYDDDGRLMGVRLGAFTLVADAVPIDDLDPIGD